jgi:hypothetical protein
MPWWVAVPVFGLLAGAASTGFTLALRSPWIRAPGGAIRQGRMLALMLSFLIVNPTLYLLAGVAGGALLSFFGASTIGAAVSAVDLVISTLVWRWCGFRPPLTRAKRAALNTGWIALGGLCAAFGAWLAR